MMLLPELSILAFSVIFLFLSLGKRKIVRSSPRRGFSPWRVSPSLCSARARGASSSPGPTGWISSPRSSRCCSPRASASSSSCSRRTMKSKNLPEYLHVPRVLHPGPDDPGELGGADLHRRQPGDLLVQPLCDRPAPPRPDADPARGVDEVPLLRRHLHGDHALRHGLPLRGDALHVPLRISWPTGRSCSPSRWGSWR